MTCSWDRVKPMSAVSIGPRTEFIVAMGSRLPLRFRCKWPCCHSDAGGFETRPYSPTTGLLRVPTPVISTSTTSPAFMFWVAPSVPIQTTSPG